jgi:hypothetical protein
MFQGKFFNPTTSVVWVVWRNFLGLELWWGLVTLMLAWEHDLQWITGKRLVGVLPSLLNCYFLEDAKNHSLSRDMDFWNPAWFAYYFLFQDVKNHSSQESLPQSLPDLADAWPKSKSYTSKPVTPVCCHLEVANSGCSQISKWEGSSLLPFQRSQCGLLVNMIVVGILLLDNLLNTNSDPIPNPGSTRNWLFPQPPISSSWIFRTQVI